ncbi:hypothetical protein Tco_0517528 [Tanacetum coccineum]|uniref:Uncharacterized protein n=1 Tax=Tanacetum coccineum TaxID=301880 RepID=A0ABQ5IW37_9ASTR
MKGLSECEASESNVSEYAEVLRRVRGGNTLTILLPSEEEQAELKDCSLMKAGNLTSVYDGLVKACTKYEVGKSSEQLAKVVNS